MIPRKKQKKMNNQLNKVLIDSYMESKAGFPYINKEDVTFVDVKNIMPYGKEVAVFNGFENNSNVSFFLCDFSPGIGPKKTPPSVRRNFYST